MKKSDNSEIELKEQDCCSQEEAFTRKTVRSEDEKHYIEGRLNRIAGQIRGVNKMIDDDRYCEDVLIQLSAIDSAIRSVSFYIMERHLKGCIASEIKAGNDEAADELMTLLRRFTR